MLVKVNCCALAGIDCVPVEVEVNVSRGQPRTTLIGLPGAAVREALDRASTAMRNSGLTFPSQRHLTINLAPADLRKEGASYDLALVLGLLASTDQLPPDALDGALVLGELSLDGSVKHVRGVLPAAILAASLGLERVFVPTPDAAEAALVPDVTVYPVDHLISLVEHLLELDVIPAYDREGVEALHALPDYPVDFSDVKGQEHVKRALEVAAAGSHNVAML